MGAVKEAYSECFAAGLVPVDHRRLREWAEKLGDEAHIISGMPMTHRIEGRFGPVDLDVIPVTVAFRIGELLPETYDELGWLVDCFAEQYL